MHFKGNHDKWIKVLQLAHTRLVHNLHSYVCVLCPHWKPHVAHVALCLLRWSAYLSKQTPASSLTRLPCKRPQRATLYLC